MVSPGNSSLCSLTTSVRNFLCDPPDFLRYSWGSLMVNQFEAYNPQWLGKRSPEEPSSAVVAPLVRHSRQTVPRVGLLCADPLVGCLVDAYQG
jgi:hypothetical protein